MSGAHGDGVAGRGAVSDAGGVSRDDAGAGAVRAGSAVVFDYSQPREVLPPVEQLMLDSLSARVAMAGEPFQLFFTPEQLAEELEWLGLRVVEDLDGAALTARYFGGAQGWAAAARQGRRMCVAAIAGIRPGSARLIDVMTYEERIGTVGGDGAWSAGAGDADARWARVCAAQVFAGSHSRAAEGAGRAADAVSSAC
jgi:hypothetical protein